MNTLRSGSMLRPAKRYARSVIDRVDRIGRQTSDGELFRQSSEYWTSPDSKAWESNSHWRGPFEDRWETIGLESLHIAQRLARMVDKGLPMGRTVEWGAGGGANAIHFAPECREFVAVDIVQESLDECARQVRAVCDTPLVPVKIPVEQPEAAIASIGEESCDLFLCLYVMELLPSPEYGLRILSLARQLLRTGGVAVIQVKYSTADLLTRPRRRGYKRGVVDMTTYAIDDFWSRADEHGLRPVAVHLVPENFLDRRYAYYLLVKDGP
jgi:SAM-dependent methyltransferase